MIPYFFKNWHLPKFTISPYSANLQMLCIVFARNDKIVDVTLHSMIAGQLFTCVLKPLRNTCDFFVISKVWNSTKTAIQTIIHHYSTKDDETQVLVIKTHNNLRFSNSITHTYINTIVYNYYIGMHYRKAQQRVSSHLNANSRLLKCRKYKNTTSSMLYKIEYYW